MNKTKHTALAAALCLTLAGPGLTGLAAEEGAPTLQLENVTVTAQKKKENLQHVPESISAISSQDIEDAGLTRTTQIHRVVPNFAVNSSNNPCTTGAEMFNIRGLGNLYEGDSAVSIYVDDVPVTDSSQFAFALDNVERIEVLRGPQGTLYGMNTEGGVINIITAQPQDRFQGNLGMSYGNYNKYRISGAMNGPLIRDSLFAGISLMTESTDGNVDNKFTGHEMNGWKSYTGSGKLLWTPSDRLNLQLNLSAADNDDGTWVWQVKDKAAYAKAWGTAIDDHEVAVNEEGYARNDSNTQSLKISYDWPWAHLTSITSRTAKTAEVNSDLDCTVKDFMSFLDTRDKEQFSQELRLASPEGKDEFSWIMGAFLSRQTADNTLDFHFGKDWARQYNDITTGTKESTTWALFGQSGVRLLDKRLGLTAGLRYEYAERSIDRDRYYIMAGRRIEANNPILGRMASRHKGKYERELDFSSWLPKFTLDFRHNDRVMTYASAALGYKAGGFSLKVNDPDLAGFDPEYAWTYEAGIKSKFLNNRLMVNISGFFTSVDDYQDRMVIDRIPVMTNAAEATIFGGEVEMRFRPVTGLLLTGSLGLIRAEYDAYKDKVGGQTVSFDGNTIAMTPDYQYNLAALYRFANGIYIRGEVAGTGAYYSDRENREATRQSAYEIVNAKIGYEAENFDIYLFGENLFNTYYFSQIHDTSMYRIPGVTEAGFAGEPLRVGVMVNYRF